MTMAWQGIGCPTTQDSTGFKIAIVKEEDKYKPSPVGKMHYATLLSLLAVPAMSVYSGLHLRDDCIFPVNFTISEFVAVTDHLDSTRNHTSFSYFDASTGFNTTCEHNANSKPSTVNTNAWPCKNSSVLFIFDTEPKPELTMIEMACPESGAKIEASGSVRPDLNCKNQTFETNCVSMTPITGVFVSLEPVPPSSR
ncbi:hypothetical protein GGR53DRAFT_298356 [Hypoxylon sp. FL1150]|nr:hypothetical protein GGR53DRAFT_298356 [Hypoxylon sp. FL1150]